MILFAVIQGPSSWDAVDHLTENQSPIAPTRIISGYGVLRCRDTAMECTAGDVLFVPRGHEHWFERLDGEIRIWLKATAAGEGESG